MGVCSSSKKQPHPLEPSLPPGWVCGTDDRLVKGTRVSYGAKKGRIRYAPAGGARCVQWQDGSEQWLFDQDTVKLETGETKPKQPPQIVQASVAQPPLEQGIDITCTRLSGDTVWSAREASEAPLREVFERMQKEIKVACNGDVQILLSSGVTIADLLERHPAGTASLLLSSGKETIP